MPWEWWISRLCEEFPGRLPTEIWAERRRCPEGLLETIAEFRLYAATKVASDRAKTATERPEGAMADLVTAIEFELAEEELARPDDDGK